MQLVRIKNAEVTPAIRAEAIKLRQTVCRVSNLNNEYLFEADGVKYAGRVERHWNPKVGAHPGITVLRVVEELPAILPPWKAYALGTRSLQRLEGVHPDLVQVVKAAIIHTPIDFTVVEGVRTLERQRELFRAGKTKILASRHITGHAVDLAPWVKGKISWLWPHFRLLGPNIVTIAHELKIDLEWGGNWDDDNLDGPHFQLSEKGYPD